MVTLTVPVSAVPSTERMLGELLASKRQFTSLTDGVELAMDLERLRLIADGAQASAAALEYLEKRVLDWCLLLRHRSPGSPLGNNIEVGGVRLSLPCADPLAMLRRRSLPLFERSKLAPSLQLDDDVLHSLFSCAGAVQLTKGCSVGCPWCLVPEERKVVARFSVSDVRWIAYNFARHLAANFTLPYWSSDPFDWSGVLEWTGESVGFPYAFQLLAECAGYTPGVSTAVPPGREEDVRRSLHIVTRISLSDVNSHRLNRRWGSFLESDPVKAKIETITPRRDVAPRLSKGPEAKGFALACFDGVVVKPTGFSNVLTVQTSKLFVNGSVAVDINLDAFGEPLPISELNGETALSRVLSSGAIEFSSWRHDGGRRQRMHGYGANTAKALLRNTVDNRWYTVDGDTGGISAN